MASRIFRIYKTMPFYNGGTEEFSNVYRYSVDTVGPDFPADRAIAVIDALVEVEANCHATNIEYTRAESAEVTITDGVKPVDVSVDLRGRNLATRPVVLEGTAPAPQNVIMLQERVGPKRWLRKFFHNFSVGFEVSEGGLAFNWDSTNVQWDAVEETARDLSPLAYTEPDGSSAEAILEAGNGTASSGDLVADPTIRWHDLKY